MKYALISFAGFVLFAFIPIFGPLQEVELAHCVLSGLLGAVIVLISIAIYKISAFPMSGRVVHKMGLAEDNQNFLLMYSMGVNVSGQIASVIAGGLILNFFAK